MRNARSLAAAVRAGLALALAGLVALTDRSAVAFAVPPNAASCAIAGTQPMNADDAVFAAPDGDASIARFTGRPARIELTEIPSSIDARVHARVGGARSLRVQGWIASSAVAVATREELVVVEGHVSARAGVAVRLVAPAGGDARVLVVSQSFALPSIVTSCASLTLDDVSWEGNGDCPPRVVHASHGAKLLDAPEGAVVFELGGADADALPYVAVVSERGAYSRVIGCFDISIDGWIETSSLGDVPMSWEITKRVEERVPDDVRSSDDRTVSTDTPLRIGPNVDARPIGVAPPGVALRVIDRKGTFASVVEVDGAIEPITGGAFWVPQDALIPIAAP
jgi:hypothetical protein